MTTIAGYSIINTSTPTFAERRAAWKAQNRAKQATQQPRGPVTAAPRPEGPADGDALAAELIRRSRGEFIVREDERGVHRLVHVEVGQWDRKHETTDRAAIVRRLAAQNPQLDFWDCWYATDVLRTRLVDMAVNGG